VFIEVEGIDDATFRVGGTFDVREAAIKLYVNLRKCYSPLENVSICRFEDGANKQKVVFSDLEKRTFKIS